MFRLLRSFRFAAIALGVVIAAVLGIIAYSFSGSPLATPEEMKGANTGKLSGKTLVFPARFGEVYGESVYGWKVAIVIDDKNGRVIASLPREAPRPDLQFGDPIYATLRFEGADAFVVRIRRR